MPTEISGSTGVNKIQDNTIVNADINSSAAIAGSKLVMPSGSVLQVVYGYTNSATGVATTSYTDIGLSASITPSNSSSKILVTWHITALLTETSSDRGYAIKTLRDSTNVYEPSTQYAHGYTYNPATDTSTQNTAHTSSSFLDSPSSTSSITYKCQAKSLDGRHVDINATGGRAMITLMEIAG
jgi:hypothetical protein